MEWHNFLSARPVAQLSITKKMVYNKSINKQKRK